MDIASMGPALPQVQKAFSMSPGNLQWVVSAYALGFGGFLLLGGRLADLFDRRKLLIGWLVVFAVASAIGGFAQNDITLILARFVKGLSAGFTAPVAMAVLLNAFREQDARNRALGTFLAIVSAGYSLGLVLGGVLTNISWRLVLFVPSVVSVIVILGAIAAVPGSDPNDTRGRERLDFAGAVTITGAAMALVYGVSRGSNNGWSDSITIGSLAAAALLLVAFITVERSVAAPLVPLGIFKRKGLVRANICMLFFGAYVGFQFVLTLYFQDKLGWSPLEAGLAFLVGGILTASTARYGAVLVTKYGPWTVATVGFVMMSIGYLSWVFLLGHVPTIAILLIQQVLGGFGFAAVYPALNIAAVGSASESEQGLASGLFNAGAQVGTGVVVAITATVMSANVDAHLGGYRAGLWVVTAITLAVTVVALIGVRASKPIPAQA